MASNDDELKNKQMADVRARNICRNIRCTECGSQSVEDSQADIAILLRKCCYLCQEFRELRHRDLDPGPGWNGILAQRNQQPNTPPPNLFMYK